MPSHTKGHTQFTRTTARAVYPCVHRPSVLPITANATTWVAFASRIATRVLPSLQPVAPSAAPTHHRSFLGLPNLPCFATFSTRLELRPLPSTGITRLPRYYGLFRHPIAPSLTVTGLRLVATTDRAIGLPMLRASPLCTGCRHDPGTATGGAALLISPSPISLPRIGGPVGLCNVLFEDCSAFTRVTACTLAKSPNVTLYTRGFRHFVTSMTAPIASGWRNIAGWVSHPLRNAAFARRTPNPEARRLMD